MCMAFVSTPKSRGEGLSGYLSLRVNLFQRKVAIGKAYFVSVFRQQVFYHGFDLMAVRALIIGEFNDHHGCFRVSSHSRRIISDLHSGRAEQDNYRRVSAQTSSNPAAPAG